MGRLPRQGRARGGRHSGVPPLLTAVYPLIMQGLQHEDNLEVLVEEPQALGGALYRTQPRSLKLGERRCDAKVEVLGGLTPAGARRLHHRVHPPPPPRQVGLG